MSKRFYHGAALIGIIGLCVVGFLVVVNPSLNIGGSAEATALYFVQDSGIPSDWGTNHITSGSINLGDYDSGNDL